MRSARAWVSFSSARSASSRSQPLRVVPACFARRRSVLLGPRLAMIALAGSACAFAVTVLERLT